MGSNLSAPPYGECGVKEAKHRTPPRLHADEVCERVKERATSSFGGVSPYRAQRSGTLILDTAQGVFFQNERQRGCRRFSAPSSDFAWSDFSSQVSSEERVERLSGQEVEAQNGFLRSSTEQAIPAPSPQPDFDYSDYAVSRSDRFGVAAAYELNEGPRELPLKPQFQEQVIDVLEFNFSSILGRSSWIKCLQLSPCETRLICSSQMETIMVMYDIESEKEVIHFDGHKEPITGACFSPGGKHLVSSSRDESMIVWDASTGKKVFILYHPAVVMCCDYSANGLYIASGCADQVRIWNGRTGKEILVLHHDTGAVVVAVSFNETGSVLSVGGDGEVVIWNVATGRREGSLRNPSSILSCSWAPDNLHIVTNDETTVRIWNVATAQVVNQWGTKSVPSRTTAVPERTMIKQADETKFVMSAVCPGYHVLTSTNDKVVQLSNPITGKETVSFFLKASVYRCSCGPNTIALGDGNGNVYVVKLKMASDKLRPPASLRRPPRH